jgi:hypothetical protein
MKDDPKRQKLLKSVKKCRKIGKLPQVVVLSYFAA